jgi:transcriptional regulator with XRE-family HTH domain
MLKTYRERYNYTQEELSEKLDISTRTLQRIENKENNPSVKTFRKLINTLNISDEDIAYIVKNELLENEDK